MSGGSYDYIYSRLEEECAGRMYDAEMNDMIKDLCQVLHDLEWWQSSDYSENEYRATLDIFKAKWFEGNREERLKGYIDNQIGILRKQLYALIGEPMAESKHLTIEELEKEPCEDAISRQRVIEELRCMDNNGCITRSINHVIDDIRNIPSVKPLDNQLQWILTQWIPVNERLPETEGYYLVTDDAGGMITIELSFFVPDSEAPWDYVNVTAWMPLPEPYKVESEE